MTLIEIREQFAKQTGRYDLVTSATTFTDNGADFYIKAGQRMLDRMLEFPKDEAEISVSLATGAISSLLTGVRAVRSVAVYDSSDDTLVYLERVSLMEMRQAFGDEKGLLNDVEQGEPVSWTLGFLRRATTPTTTTEATGLQLVTMPPADRTYTLLVDVLDQSASLSADSSVSFWSVDHPEVLIQAAIYQLEVSYRNNEGAQAIKRSIQEAVIEVSNDVIEQSLVDESVLQDSFRFIRQPRRKGGRQLG